MNNMNLKIINDLIDKLYITINECKDIVDECVEDLKEQNEKGNR